MTATRRAVTATALVVGFALGVGACTSDSNTADDSATSAATAPTSSPTATSDAPAPSDTSSPSVDPTPSTAPTSDETSPATPSPDATASVQCTEDERAAMEEVVRDQLAAFSAGDFAAARDLASETFRAGIDLDDFEALITEEYPVVLADTDPAFGRCAATDPGGLLEVAVSGPDGVAELVYLLVREDGRWAIEAAQYTTPPGDDGVVT